jgi:glycosyltransferase involved in cell wall biosynthesis
MQFKQERWNGTERQELVNEVGPEAQQQFTVPVLTEERISDETMDERVGPDGVEVVVVADSPRAVFGCLQAYHHAKVYGFNYHLTVVNNGADEFLTCSLWTLAQKHGFKLLIAPEPGQLPGLMSALRESKARWFVILSQHTRVYDEWLNHLFAVVDKQTAMVTANSNRVVPIAEGLSASAMADSFARTLIARGSTFPFPREGCLLVNREALDDCGGFDLDYYRPGGGQFLDFYLQAHRKGYLVKLAERCWVHDTNADYRGGASWEPQSRHGFYRFLSRYGKEAMELHHAQYEKMDFPQSIASQFKPGLGKRREVVFVFREVSLCGLVLAVAEICNGLNRTNEWNATFVCTKFDEPERKRIPMNFAPVVLESEVVQMRWLHERRNAALIGTLWNTAELLHESEAHPSCRKVYFVQDDERRFRSPAGVPYVEAEKVVAAWRKFPNRVVNSQWVRNAMQTESCLAKRIGIGVDTNRFFPRVREERPLRVMAHSRPSTPRRGWEFIREVINRAAKSAEFDFITYDEEPTGLSEQVSGSHLGKVSPDELAEHMGRSDIFFEGSEFQGWGMQALEAMSSGCALVSTDNEGVQEFTTPGYDSVLVKHGEVEQSAAVLCHLLQNAFERRALQDRARQSAIAFDWSAICRAWAEYLKTLFV